MAITKVCSVADCGKPHSKRGYCNAHFLRWKRHGDPLATKRRVDPNNCGKKECPAAKKVWAHIHYLKNTEAYKHKSSRWREENPEAYRDNIKNYLSRVDVQERARARTKEWSTKNQKRKRELDAEFKAKNPAKVTSYKARYRAARRQATPSWLTDEQNARILAVYKEARRLTESTGIPHEVDHIVPLVGRVVSGLHVPWNLRAIPKVENNRRPRIWSADEVVSRQDISLADGAE